MNRAPESPAASPDHPSQMRPSRRRLPRLVLPLLVLTSGFCGISYEILYTRLLGNLLGNQFTINATVLLTFLLGIGLGTLAAHRFVRFLWAIEAGIGLYAAFMVAAYDFIDALLFRTVPDLGTSLGVCAAVGIALLLTPAFLIGCSLPLFAAYLSSLRGRHVFSFTYAIYNVGAAATALVMEFVLLRSVGLRAATLLLACLNAAVAVSLLALGRRAPIAPPPPVGRIRFPKRVIAALALASVASAAFQLLMIKLGEFVLGPFNETFALVLASVLLGLTIGSVAVARFSLGFAGALVLALAGLVFLLLGLPTAAGVYATLHPAASQAYPTLVLLKFGLVFALTGPAAVGFGATIPALLRTSEHVARESGELLFVSSMANAAGFLLMAFGLHRYLDYGPILLVVAALGAAALLVHAGGLTRPAWLGLGLLAAAFGFQRTAWDEDLLYLGHTSFHSRESLSGMRAERILPERFKDARDVFALVWLRGEPHFFINGYFSIPLNDPSEKMVGALSAMLAPRTDDALVLGLGSGATAGTVGLLFERTDAVEINAAVLDNLYRMAEWNFDIERLPGVRIIHDDGIRFIKTSDRRYSLILNTVTTPLYFSSSKLYTRDFLELVSQRLAPDGIYVSWMDMRVGDSGIDIILETLAREFVECWTAYVSSAYFLNVCSNAELGVRQLGRVTSEPRLRQSFQQQFGLPLALLPYAILSTEVTSLREPGAAVNTLDFPALEFAMARLTHDPGIDRFRQRIFGGVDLGRLHDRLGRTMSWRPDDLRRYAELRRRHLRRRLGEAAPEAPPPRLR